MRCWGCSPSGLSVGRAELFAKLEYHFSFRKHCTHFSLHETLNTLKAFRKGIICLYFQTVLLVDLTTRIHVGLFHCMMEDARSSQAQQSDAFQKQQQ